MEWQPMDHENPPRGFAAFDYEAALKRIAELEAEVHEARAWTIGPAIAAFQRDAILSMARRLHARGAKDPTPCHLEVAARLLEKWAHEEVKQAGGE